MRTFFLREVALDMAPDLEKILAKLGPTFFCVKKKNRWRLLSRAAKLSGEVGVHLPAEQLLQEALSSAERLCGPSSIQAGVVLLDLADFYERQGMPLKAATCYERVLQNLRLYVRQHPKVLKGKLKLVQP